MTPSQLQYSQHWELIHTYITFIIQSGHFSAIGTNWGQNRLRERFPANSCLEFREIYRHILDFMVRNAVKLDHLDIRPLVCRKRSAFEMHFHLIVVLIFGRKFRKNLRI